VRASYLQIYNEVISDLLKPEKTNLVIREDRKRGVFVDGERVQAMLCGVWSWLRDGRKGIEEGVVFCLSYTGLSEWVVRSPAEVYSLMERGASMRTTGATKMNEISSRSHAVFIVIVENSVTLGEWELSEGR
jgi:kinesin family protein 3/17